ncbi:MAG: 16S rRNA (adenine(1518)-N(6)/adenine(1519)-N(6))-dimethyltransferase RsmA [Candidatus Parcubacteria bacterium]|nr:16S rRNA (adenine(1518)-N(6)/adenine(1519)-N(6))-dimethyltransferase RsmA [Candidatus Parcubacteria bacterium]
MKAKKSLGQNFLKSEPALKKIIEAGEIKNTDVILEIGPGKGALTKKLLSARNAFSIADAGGENTGKVIAVEKDDELFDFLQEKFAPQIESGSLVLVHDDILKLEIRNYDFSNYKVIANIPYNITGAILKKFLTEKNQPKLMVLMVQHEVAKRIIANDGKESILSISVKAYGEPKMIMKVPARYFSPAPKVDSAIIAIKNISRKLFTSMSKNSPLEEYPLGGGGRISTPSRKRATPQEGNNNFEERFWEIVKAGFAHKRKKLSGNLKSLKDYSLGKTSGVEEKLGNKRAEDLALSDWIKLAQISTKN